MESDQIAALVLMQVFVVPGSYFLWAVYRATWLSFASDKSYAADKREQRVDPSKQYYPLFVIWLALNVGLVMLAS